MTGAIAFDANGPQGQHVWVIDDNGVGPAQNLTAGATTRNTRPTWSPDGKRIAFIRYPIGFDSQVMVMNADGTNQQQLTTGGGAHDHPAWSPPFWEELPRLVVNAGTIAITVAHGVNALLGLFGRRLPGRWVTKIAYMNPPYTIRVINEDGTNERQIYGYYPGSPGDGIEPAWSPDGAQIAFTHYYVIPSAQTFRVAIMHADGSGVMDIPSGTPVPGPPTDANPAWSPDGGAIAFETDRSGNRQVWAMKTNGAGLVNVTNRSPGDDNSPAWSPDGQQIAFVSDRSGTFDIWTMAVNGTGLNNITKGGYGMCGNPAWSSTVLPPGPQP